MSRLFIKIVVCIGTFFLNTVYVDAQQFKWVKGGGTSEDFSSLPSRENEQVKFMCTDPDGNIYALNQVGNNPIHADTFYRSTGAYGANVNLLVTSYNCNGQMRWAKLIASQNDMTPYSITADNLGNVYVCGYFVHVGGAHTLYIGYDTTISNVGSEYLGTGIIQFDTLGHYKWIRFACNTNNATALSGTGGGPVIADAASNVHYFCYVKSGISLMPSVTSVFGTYDMTYNTSGTLLSAVRLDLDSQWFLHGAVIDPTSNKLYVCGEINQSLSGATDSFYAAAFDASRNKLWQYFCGHGDDDAITGVVMDQSKSLYFSGADQSGYFSFNGDSVHGSGNNMAIVMKTDTSGNVKWIKHFDNGLSSVNGFNSITLLPNDKVAAFGTFAGATTNGTVSLSTSAGEGYSPYFVVLDSGGILHSIQQIHGDGFYNGGVAITSDRIGNIYVGGQVEDSIWAGVPHIPAYHTVGGNTDFFVMKYGVDCSCTAAPTASYTDTGSHTLGVAYTGTTSGLDSVVWSFGDGNTTTGTTAIHTYTASGTYHVCVTVYTNCGSDTHCSDVTIHVPSETAIILSNGEIKIYPNPANDALNITGVQENASYNLLSITGSSMLQGVLQQGNNTISMKNLTAGVYILELSSGNGERKIVRVVKE